MNKLMLFKGIFFFFLFQTSIFSEVKYYQELGEFFDKNTLKLDQTSPRFSVDFRMKNQKKIYLSYVRHSNESLSVVDTSDFKWIFINTSKVQKKMFSSFCFSFWLNIKKEKSFDQLAFSEKILIIKEQINFFVLDKLDLAKMRSCLEGAYLETVFSVKKEIEWIESMNLK